MVLLWGGGDIVKEEVFVSLVVVFVVLFFEFDKFIFLFKDFINCLILLFEFVIGCWLLVFFFVILDIL